MPSLDSFNAFVRATGVKIATSPDNILNDATKNTYFLGRMLKGRDAAQSVQSGQKIEERVQLSDNGTFGFMHPNEDLDIQNVDNLTPIKVDWRFGIDHYSYTKQEVELNSGDPQTYYKNLLKSKRQACKTSTFNGMEDALWATPTNSGMEAASGKVPYSIPTFITKDGNAPTGFTTIMGIDPALEAGFRNQTESYDPSNITDTQDGLVRAIDRMWHKCRFVAPAGGPSEYFENDLLQKMVIATNLDGITILQSLTRDANDRLTPANNLGWVAGKVTYAGLPIEYVSTLDTALLDGGSAIPAGKPWFWFINLNFLYPIFHTRMYMSEEDPLRHPRQPFSWVVWSTTWYNLFGRSRRRQGLVSAA